MCLYFAYCPILLLASLLCAANASGTAVMETNENSTPGSWQRDALLVGPSEDYIAIHCIFNLRLLFLEIIRID